MDLPPLYLVHPPGRSQIQCKVMAQSCWSIDVLVDWDECLPQKYFEYNAGVTSLVNKMGHGFRDGVVRVMKGC